MQMEIHRRRSSKETGVKREGNTGAESKRNSRDNRVGGMESQLNLAHRALAHASLPFGAGAMLQPEQHRRIGERGEASARGGRVKASEVQR